MHWLPLCSNKTCANQLHSRPSIILIGTKSSTTSKDEKVTKKNQKECRKIFIFERLKVSGTCIKACDINKVLRDLVKQICLFDFKCIKPGITA